MAMSTNLREVRRRVARSIGFYLASTVTSGTVSSLTDAKHPIKSTNQQEDWLSGKWILRPNAALEADKVRVVGEEGYTPTSGAIQPDSDWSGAPSAGEVYELHGAVEPWTELNDIINTALMRCYIVSEIAVAATGGASRHGLQSAAPWLRVAPHVRQIGYLYAGESRNVVDPFRRSFWGTPVEDDGGVSVEHPSHTFDGTETIYLRCVKPAYFACRASGGTFGEQDGLSADTDEAPVAVSWVAAAARVEYWERYSGTLSEDDPGAKSAESRQMKAAAEFDTETATWFRLPPITYRTLPIGTGMGRGRW